MKKQKLMLFCSVFVLSFLGIVLFSAQSAFAATKTWDGSSNNNFNTGANWSGSTIPADGDDIVIPYNVIYPGECDSVADTLNNDLTGVSFASISITEVPDDCYSAIFIEGNEVEVAGDISGNDNGTSSPQLRFETDVAITANATIGAVYGFEDLAIGSNNVNVASTAFAGGVSGSGDITISQLEAVGGGIGCGDGTETSYPFSGTSSGFNGAINVTNGALFITRRTGDVARFASSITKEADARMGFRLDYGKDLSLATDMTIEGGDVFATQGTSADCDTPTTRKTVTLSGDVTFTADTTFDLYKTNIKFTGSVTGKSKIILPDGEDGKITFSDGSAIESKIEVVTISDESDCGTYNFYSTNHKTVVNVDCSGSVSGAVRGILGGTGKVGNITISGGGIIAPGESPGVLETGDIEFEEGGIYDFEMAGTKAGDYDQIKVDGTVTLGDGTLNVDAIDGFVPDVGDKFTIINNNGSDAVDGRFDGLAQGAVFTDDGIQFRISYNGGSGNDVVLTVLAIVDAPDTGSAKFTNNPLAIILVTIACSGAIAYIATRYNKGASAA